MRTVPSTRYPVRSTEWNGACGSAATPIRPSTWCTAYLKLGRGLRTPPLVPTAGLPCCAETWGQLPWPGRETGPQHPPPLTTHHCKMGCQPPRTTLKSSQPDLAADVAWVATMRLLLAASEVVGFAKTGGLADVAG